MSTERDELADILMSDALVANSAEEFGRDYALAEADAILAAGYRKIFDGDCGLSNVKDPTDREAAEAWMRWANLAMNDEIGAIKAMKQMLTEFGYRKARIITAAEELDALPVGSVVFRNGRAFQRFAPHPAPFDEYRMWKCTDGGFVRSTKDGSSILPATVLYDPEPQP